MLDNSILNQAFKIGTLLLKNRVIQGPLAGYSCAPFRALFYDYKAPAYAVSEMLSSTDVLHKHQTQSRYLSRASTEHYLAYQISGTDPEIMAAAANKLQQLGADIIDINCGCPKTKIRKKGAGSALLENPSQLTAIIKAVRAALSIPLSVKIRIQNPEADRLLASAIEQAGADALIVHGRRWQDDYDIASNAEAIARIKSSVSIPVIANGDISDRSSLQKVLETSQSDAFMIARAGCGKPWLYKSLLSDTHFTPEKEEIVHCFMKHIQGLAELESETKALLQARSLSRYYFRDYLQADALAQFYICSSLKQLSVCCDRHLLSAPAL